MSFDGMFLHVLIQELNQVLLNGRLTKIQQPYQSDLVLTIRQNRHNYHLLLSAQPEIARMQLTDITFANPDKPSNFVMTLRKYLEGAILLSIQQIEADRSIILSFRSQNELGDSTPITLRAEFMGRHSNIFLIDETNQRLLECIKHVGPSQNRVRTLLPGALFTPLSRPQAANPLEPLTNEIAEQLFNDLHDLKNIPVQVVQSHLQGMGRDTATALAMALKKAANPEEIIEKVTQFIQELEHVIPTLGDFQGKPVFSSTPLACLTDITTYPEKTLSQLLDHYFNQRAQQLRRKELASQLQQRLTTLLKRSEHKLTKLQQELSQAENAEHLRIKGELLMSFLHEVPDHVNQVTLANYYDDNHPLLIQLAPEWTANKNAQHYFARYQKARNSLKYLNHQVELTQEERRYYQTVLAQIDVGDPQDILDIQSELIEQGIMKPKRQTKKIKKHRVRPPEKFITADGVEILVGKNNLQNEKLTLHTAQKQDIWLHTKNIPGSHVIVRTPHPTTQTLVLAAQLAAYFSKARLSGSVPVDYVPVKKIKKPNGSRPGFVIYEGQKTLYVTPDVDVITKLRQETLKRL